MGVAADQCVDAWHLGRELGVLCEAEVRQHHARLARGARVAVGGMGGNLLVPDVDEPDRAVLEGRQHCDIGMAAQAEDMPDATVFEIFYQLAGNEILHPILLEFIVRIARPRRTGRDIFCRCSTHQVSVL